MGTGDERYPVDAPGWAAIDRAFGTLYGDQQPHQYVSKTGYELDSRSPLPAISVWAAAGNMPGRDPIPHWHFVTYGLSELFDKSSDDPHLSGFGFELTLRLLRDPSEPTPPPWGVRLMQALGHYVLSGHAQLDSGHLVDLGAPLSAAAHDTTATSATPRLTGVMCLPDPQFDKLQTVHGSLLFLQLFGLTADELEAMTDWDLARKVGLVDAAWPLALTDPARGPMSEDPKRAPIFRRFALNVLV